MTELMTNATLKRECACGNRLENEPEDVTRCRWCDEAEYYAEMRRESNDPCTIIVSRFTGDVTCAHCSKWCDCLVCTAKPKEDES